MNSNIKASNLAFGLTEKTQKIANEIDNHFIDNVLKPILHPYANLDNLKFDKYYSGVVDVFYASVPLPKLDNFYYPQEFLVHSTLSNSAGLTFPIEYLPQLLPSVKLNTTINLLQYKSFKLEKILTYYEKSSVFYNFGIFENEFADRETTQIPKHMCLLLFSNFSTKTDYFTEESFQKYYTVKLLIYFPVNKNVENRYAKLVNKESSYLNSSKNLVIEVTANYTLNCEEILL